AQHSEPLSLRRKAAMVGVERAVLSITLPTASHCLDRLFYTYGVSIAVVKSLNEICSYYAHYALDQAKWYTLVFREAPKTSQNASTARTNQPPNYQHRKCRRDAVSK